MNPRRILLSIGLMLATAAASQAHSTSLIVNRPVAEPGGKVTVFMAWGHRLPVDELVTGADIEQYQILSPSGSTTPLDLDERSLQAREIVLDQTGLYQVSAARASSVFTRYTEASGRSVHARGPKSEVELPEGATIDLSARSSQFAKALIVCGTPEPGGLAAPVGHALEIVLEATPGPGGFSPDEPIQARVLFRGEPLAGVPVYASSTTLNPDGSPSVSAETDAEGRVALDLFEPGTWVLQASYRYDAPDDQRASYDTESFLATFSVPVGEE